MNEQRLLLINPYIHDFSAYDFWMKPLGLLYLASILNDAGYNISFIDCVDRFAPETEGVRTKDFPKAKADGRGKLFREEIRKPSILDHIPKTFSRYGMPVESFRARLTGLPRLDAVLVTSYMTYWYTGVQETIREIRKVFPNTPVILGGIYATLMPKHARQLSGADFVVTGESENQVIDAVEKATALRAQIRKTYQSLDDYPLPMYSLLSDAGSLPILTSRGCPFCCLYCASGLLMPSFRRRNPHKVVDEIEHHYNRFGTRHFAFYDDALLVDKENHFQIILSEIIRRNVKVSFHMPNAIHGRYIDEEIARLMHEAGCKTIRIGLESSDKNRQDESGNKISSDEFLRAVTNLDMAGYDRKDIEVYIMMGLPQQDAGEVQNSIRFVHNAGCTVRLVSFTPIPGTDYWNEAIAIKPSIAEDPILHNNSIYPLNGTSMEWKDFSAIKEMTRKLNAVL
jgi:radical SAM superfamily enzyme YgiQ (UPF0313 family)